MTTEVTISCPHCRRQYPIKVDPERLQRLKTRATCGRCGNAFDVAARVAAAAVTPSAPAEGAAIGRAVERKPSLAPPSQTPSDSAVTSPSGRAPASANPSPLGLASTLLAVPSPTATPTSLPRSQTPTPPMRLERIKPPAPPVLGSIDPDDMAELAREFADAAARFTPVLRAPAGTRERDAATAMTMRTPPVPPPLPPPPDETSPSPTSPSLASPSPTSPSLASPSPMSPDATTLTLTSSPAPSPEETTPALSPITPALAPVITPPSAPKTRPSVPRPPLAPTMQLSAITPGPTTPLMTPLVPAPSPEEMAPTLTLSPVRHDEAPAQRLLDDSGDNDFDAAENTLKRPKQAPLPPLSWLELADPGLEALTAPPSPTAALLDGILSQPGAPPPRAS